MIHGRRRARQSSEDRSIIAESWCTQAAERARKDKKRSRANVNLILGSVKIVEDVPISQNSCQFMEHSSD